MNNMTQIRTRAHTLMFTRVYTAEVFVWCVHCLLNGEIRWHAYVVSKKQYALNARTHLPVMQIVVNVVAEWIKLCVKIILARPNNRKWEFRSLIYCNVGRIVCDVQWVDVVLVQKLGIVGKKCFTIGHDDEQVRMSLFCEQVIQCELIIDIHFFSEIIRTMFWLHWFLSISQHFQISSNFFPAYPRGSSDRHAPKDAMTTHWEHNFTFLHRIN